ncbi:MAG: DNA-directed RNA polymerase subunit alpha [Chloroflexi bacterium]|nr:DNA-directed RNA polymerase subunit alpha [Chloroflexota bacterium]
MSSLVVPNIECVECVDNFGRFRAEPLEKGAGVTLGNSLRRVLLAYLPGAAITRVKIEGLEHEFSVIPHAKEDVMEFLLNIKALRLKPVSGRPGKLILDVQGEKRITAADIKPSADFEIINPELYLVTLNTPEAKLYAELDVELGMGFRQAQSSDDMPVGTIPVDAIFTPTRKVNITIEPVHAGRETSHERLYLDLWTDGTISPTEAVSQGARILMEQLAPFVDYAKVSQMKAEERLIRLAIPDEKFNMPVEQLDLSVRTMNCLRRSGITTVGEIIAKGPRELMKLRNFGQKSFLEIESRLASLGLAFGPQPELPGEAEAAPGEPETEDSTGADESADVPDKEA